MKTLKYILFIFPILFIGCRADEENSFFDDEVEEAEELSDFAKILDNTFGQSDLPYNDFVNFDNYEEGEFLTEKEFELLELYYVYPEGYERRKYEAINRIETERGLTYVTVLSHDSDNEMTTNFVVYNEEEWYVDHVMIGYDEIAEGFLQIYSTIEADTITRTTSIFFDEEMLETEHYYIQKDGDIVWEQDM